MSIYATDLSQHAPPAPKAKKKAAHRTEAQIAATKKAAETYKANKAALKLEIEKTEKLSAETVAKKENKRKAAAASRFGWKVDDPIKQFY
jgi:septal ring factor EnvC (AmiA/AmiB activator)